MQCGDVGGHTRRAAGWESNAHATEMPAIHRAGGSLLGYPIESKRQEDRDTSIGRWQRVSRTPSDKNLWVSRLPLWDKAHYKLREGFRIEKVRISGDVPNVHPPRHCARTFTRPGVGPACTSSVPRSDWLRQAASKDCLIPQLIGWCRNEGRGRRRNRARIFQLAGKAVPEGKTRGKSQWFSGPIGIRQVWRTSPDGGRRCSRRIGSTRHLAVTWFPSCGPYRQGPPGWC